MKNPAFDFSRATWLFNIGARFVFFCILLFSSLSYVQAQSLLFAVNLERNSEAITTKAELVLSDLELEEVKLDARIAAGISTPLELGLGLRSNTFFGPLGNVLIGGRADLDTSGRFAAALSASGIIATVAARAELLVFNVNSSYFRPQEAFDSGLGRNYLKARLLSEIAYSLTLGASFRLDRTTVLELDPRLLYFSGGDFGAQLSGALQLRRLVERDDGAVLLLAELQPDNERSYLASGFEYKLNRRNLSFIKGSLWLGLSEQGLQPGARLSISGSISTATTYEFKLSAEPYRSDTLPYRAIAGLQSNTGPGELEISVFASYDDNINDGQLGLSLGYSWSF